MYTLDNNLQLFKHLIICVMCNKEVIFKIKPILDICIMLK